MSPFSLIFFKSFCHHWLVPILRQVYVVCVCNEPVHLSIYLVCSIVCILCLCIFLFNNNYVVIWCIFWIWLPMKKIFILKCEREGKMGEWFYNKINNYLVKIIDLCWQIDLCWFLLLSCLVWINPEDVSSPVHHALHKLTIFKFCYQNKRDLSAHPCVLWFALYHIIL